MRIKEIRRRILGGCLACFLCFTGSIPAFAAETATPANADERREIPQGLESEASETLEIGTPEASEEVSLVLVTEIQKEDELLSLPDFTLPLRATPSDDDLEEMPPAVITSIEQWYPYTDAFAVQQGSGTEALENLFAFSPYYLDCYAENGTSYTAVVEWDFSGIDLNTVGLYHAIGKLSAPANTAFAEGIAFPEISIPVSVQASGRPDINCFLAARGNLRFPWVTPPGELDEISVWLSENNGSWNQLGNGIYVGREMLSIATRLLTPGSSYRLQVDYDGGQTGILSFTYADEIVLEGYHEGDRDGGDAGGNPPDTIIQPPPEDTGDQDDGFADRPSTKPPKPPVTNGGAEEALEPDAGSDEPAIPEIEAPVVSGQPEENTALQQPPEVRTITDAPELTAPDPARKLSENRKEPVQSIMTVPPESADSKKPVFSEFFDETTDRISGTRFLMMLQTGEQRAIFSKQGITISIPKDTLPEGIQNEDQIEVIIQKDTDGGFSFSFSINGTVLNSLPDVSVMLPYPNDPAAGTLFLCDESGVEVPMTGYDDTAKAASFQISHTGTYTIVGKEDTASLAHAADTEHSWSPIFFLIPACLFLLSAGVFFLKRRRK